MTAMQMTDTMLDVLDTTGIEVTPSFSRKLLDILPKILEAAKSILAVSPEGSPLRDALKGSLSNLFSKAEALEGACQAEAQARARRSADLGHASAQRPSSQTTWLQAINTYRRMQISTRDALLSGWSNIVALDVLLDPTKLKENANGREIWDKWMAYDQLINELRTMLVEAMKFELEYMPCIDGVEVDGLKALRNCAVLQRKPRARPPFIQPPSIRASFTDPPVGGKNAKSGSEPKSKPGPVKRYWNNRRSRQTDGVDDSHKQDGC